MKHTNLRLSGAYLLEPTVHRDERGFFFESHNELELKEQGIYYNFIQDNHALSTESGVLRGLHYQINPRAQTKLVRVISGAIYDVIVDLRKSSNTYRQWFGVILSEHNYRQLLVPTGFAHGYCTLVPNTQVLYKVDEYYSPEHDRGILWNDLSLNIDWPTSNPILSIKDQQHPLIKDAEINFE